MSYINKKTKIFNGRNEQFPLTVRSEGRIKDYFSALDLRAWSDIVEERRQHILEHQAINREVHINVSLSVSILKYSKIIKKQIVSYFLLIPHFYVLHSYTHKFLI